MNVNSILSPELWRCSLWAITFSSGFCTRVLNPGLCRLEVRCNQSLQNRPLFSLRTVWDSFPYTCSSIVIFCSSVCLCGAQKKTSALFTVSGHIHRWVTVQLWGSFKEKTQLLIHKCDNSSHFSFLSRFFGAHGTLLSCERCSKEFSFRGCEESRLWCLWRGLKKDIHLLAVIFSRSPWHFCAMMMISNVRKEHTNISYLQPHYVCINDLSARYFDAYRILKITLI